MAAKGCRSKNVSMFFSNSIANRKGFLPCLSPFRAWTGGGEHAAGSWATDQLRAIAGVGAEGLADTAANLTGAFFSNYAVTVGGFVGVTETSAVYACANAFDSSRVVPTGLSPFRRTYGNLLFCISASRPKLECRDTR